MLLAGIFVAGMVSFFEFWINFHGSNKYRPVNLEVSQMTQAVDLENEWTYLPPKRCFWIEAIQELRFASWCMNKQRKPELNYI